MDKNMIQIKKIGNSSVGYLSFFEVGREISFSIKRIYYVYETSKDIIRGKHAHKKNNQYLWCPYGKIELLLKNGYTTKTIILDNPNYIINVKPGIWHEMKWLKNKSVLCVAASDEYDEDDYIRKYDEFIDYVKVGYWKNED